MPNRPVATSATVDGSGMAATFAIGMPPLASAVEPVPSQTWAPGLSPEFAPPSVTSRSSKPTVVSLGKSVVAGNLQRELLEKSTLQTPIWLAAPAVDALNDTMTIWLWAKPVSGPDEESKPNPAGNEPSPMWPMANALKPIAVKFADAVSAEDAEPGLVATPTSIRLPNGLGLALARSNVVLPPVPQLTVMSAYELSAKLIANAPATTYLIVLFMCLSLSLFYCSLTGPVLSPSALFIGS